MKQRADVCRMLPRIHAEESDSKLYADMAKGLRQLGYPKLALALERLSKDERRHRVVLLSVKKKLKAECGR